MEVTASPRRILADRDVNKPVVKSPSTMKTSPLKPSPFPINAGIRSSSLEVVRLAKPLVSAKAGAAEKSTNSIGTKRAIDCLGDVPEGPSQKHIISNTADIGCKAMAIKAGHFEPRAIASDDMNERVGRPADDHEFQQNIKESPSPDSSFNTTEDYWNDESQNTTLTEPDLVPPNVPAFAINHAPGRRAISPQEARVNAEALRLRLKMAMYKINTNQTDLPLSQVQIRPSSSSLSFTSISPTPNPLPQLQTQSKTRKPLPIGHSIPAHTQTTHDSIEIGIPTSQSTKEKDDYSKIVERRCPSAASRKADSVIPPVRQPIANEDKEEFIETPNLPPLRTTPHDFSRSGHEVEVEKKEECQGGNNRSLAAASSVVQGSVTDGLLTLSARATLELMGYT